MRGVARVAGEHRADAHLHQEAVVAESLVLLQDLVDDRPGMAGVLKRRLLPNAV